MGNSPGRSIYNDLATARDGVAPVSVERRMGAALARD
jgi:hypothetical protein